MSCRSRARCCRQLRERRRERDAFALARAVVIVCCSNRLMIVARECLLVCAQRGHLRVSCDALRCRARVLRARCCCLFEQRERERSRRVTRAGCATQLPEGAMPVPSAIANSLPLAAHAIFFSFFAMSPMPRRRLVRSTTQRAVRQSRYAVTSPAAASAATRHAPSPQYRVIPVRRSRV